MATETLTDVIIRPATEADIPRIERFIAPFVEDGTLLPRTVDELAQWFPNFFIAELHGEMVGCAALEIYSKKLAEIRSLAVAPAFQGSGVGKRLVAACVELAREKDVLEVMTITASEDFFKACGFDFTLPGLKKALFFPIRDDPRP